MRIAPMKFSEEGAQVLKDFNAGSTDAVEILDLSWLPSWVVPIASALYDVWVEALIVALALHVYLRLTRLAQAPRHPVGKGNEKKVAPVPPSPLSRGGSWEKVSGKTPGLKEKQTRGSGVAARSSAASRVQLFASELSQKGRAFGGDALRRYEDLVRGERLDLRDHLLDGGGAFYSTLLECAVHDALGRAAGRPQGVSAKASTSRLLADMRVFGFPRTQEFYAAALKCHVNAKLYQDCLWIHDVMLADGGTPDRHMYTYLLIAAVSCHEDQRAKGFFRDLSKTGPAPMRTCMIVLRMFAKAGDEQAAIDLLAVLRSAGGAPDALVLNVVLDLCVSQGSLEKAESLLTEWAESSDAVSCNIVLKGYAQQARLPDAEILLARMLEKGPAPTTITFNTIMDCAVRAIQVQTQNPDRLWTRARRDDAPVASGCSVAQRPWTLLEQLLELGLLPDKYTASTLVKGLHLNGCCSSKGISIAVELVRQLGPRGLKGSDDASSMRLSEVVFNSLLDACTSIGDLDRMAEIFNMMRLFEVPLSSVTFGTLIKAFGQAGRLPQCHEAWQSMVDAKVTPTVITYGCYVDVCIRNKHLVAAERVFRSMFSLGVRPNAVIYTTMIRGYANEKQPLKALELYREMRREGVDASAVAFNSVLDILVRQLADPAKLEEVIDDMRKANVPPDVVTYSILIKASCNAGQLQSAFSLFRQLRAHGLAFDEVAFNTLLHACSKAGKVAEADEILAEMRSVGIAPTQVTVSILVKMYGQAKMLDRALELSEVVEREHGLPPNTHVYTCLIQACVRNRQVRKSWEVFGRMLSSEGVRPDAVTYGTVIHGCIYNTKFEQALALVRHAHGRCSNQALFRSLAIKAPPGEDGPHCAGLQPEVLQALTAALRRKGQHTLLAELEEITFS